MKQDRFCPSWRWPGRDRWKTGSSFWKEHGAIPILSSCRQPRQSPLTRSCSRVEATFAAVREEWADHQADIELLLRHDGNLSRGEKELPRSIDVDELLPKVAEACAISNPPIRRTSTNFRVSLQRRLPREQREREPLRSIDSSPSARTSSTRWKRCSINLPTNSWSSPQAELPKRKARTNTVTYDDLISGLRDALRQNGGSTLARAIGDKYSAALIDEFQDTDPAQYEIFRTIFGSKDHRLFLIGDPKQAIYGFRGADVFTYFQANTIADHTFTLTTNWRSEAPLLTAINRLFLQTEQPFIFSEIQYHEVHAPKKPLVRPLTKTDDAAAALRFRLVTPAEDQASSIPVRTCLPMGK